MINPFSSSDLLSQQFAIVLLAAVLAYASAQYYAGYAAYPAYGYGHGYAAPVVSSYGYYGGYGYPAYSAGLYYKK